jgi:hypothetical protein
MSYDCIPLFHKRAFRALFLLAAALPVLPTLPAAAAAAADTAMPFPLAGSWRLVAADLLLPDGSRVRDYGAAPGGLLLIDSQGRYSLQIYKSERPLFAAGDKAGGTAAEYEAASMGASAHFGTIAVDSAERTLTFSIEHAAFKNWEGSKQKRSYQLDGDELSYRVPARADGKIPLSVWRRIR